MLNPTIGRALDDLSVVPRTFVIVTVAVPIVIYGVMPHLHRLRRRLLLHSVVEVRGALATSRWLRCEER